MKYPSLLILFHCLFITYISFSQEWRLFTAADAVNDFELHGDDLWVISGSGLTKINIQNGEQTNWNTVNSELPDYGFDEMTIDAAGTVWLGGSGNHRLTRFDGSQWETMSSIDENEITTIYDLKVTPDGKVWIYGNFGDSHLFYFENDHFYNVVPPDEKWNYFTGTLSNIGISTSSHLWTIFRDTAFISSTLGEFYNNQWILHDLASLGAYLGPGDNWVSDRHGNIYMLVASSIGPMFLKYDGVQWQPLEIPAIVNDYLNHRRPMYIDAMDRIWIGLDNNTFIRYDGVEWTTINLDDIGLSSGFPDGLFIDTNDVQWIFYNKTSNNGRVGFLYQYNGLETKRIDLSNSKIPTNIVEPILIDRQNNKWIGSGSGLIKFNGTKWTLIPQGINYSTLPVASNTTGGVWLSSYNSELTQFDGVAISSIDLTNEEGMPYNFIQKITVNKEGKVYVATGEQEVLVFDHGEMSYLDSMLFVFFEGFLEEDLSLYVALDTFGRLYSMGYGLHRLEVDGSWTEIPLWEENPIGTQSFVLSPNGEIWIAYGVLLPGRGHKYKIFNGVDWITFTSSFKKASYPKWDPEGNMWMSTEQGLCKQENNIWHCYDEYNSPLTPGRVESFAIDAYHNVWITLDHGGLLLFNEDKIKNIEGVDLPLVGGCVYRDLNQNGTKDSEDTPLAFHKALLLPDSLMTFSNYGGSYLFSVAPGDYEVKYVPRDNWHINNSPDSYLVTVATGPISDLNFIVEPDEEMIDLRLFINEGFPRCNRIVPYWLSYGNFGTKVEDGAVIFIKDPKTTFIQSQPDPSTVSGDTIVWTFSHQLPFSTDEIFMELKLAGPSADDSTIVMLGYLDRLYQNSLMHQDSFRTEQWLECAYDPNDKIARTKNTRDDGKSLLEDPIQYTIRFQNTGNDTAFNVVIRDTLDANLDLNTLEIIGASHPFETYVKPDGLLEFRFINILLPDSLINEPASHGFVSYTIRAKQDLPSPTIISNTAHIYFDYNLAVKTNATYNELIKLIINTKEFEKITSAIKVYPNPVSEEIILEIAEEVMDNSVSYEIMDVFGRRVLSGTVQKDQPGRVYIGQLSEGIYFIYAYTDGSRGLITFIKGNK